MSLLRLLIVFEPLELSHVSVKIFDCIFNHVTYFTLYNFNKSGKGSTKVSAISYCM